MFKLNIECTRDFDELHIVFSDGSTTVVTNKHKDNQQDNISKKERKKDNSPELKHKHQKDDLLDTDTEWGGVSHDIVQKPVITERDRPVNVAEELQNLDI